MLLEKTLQASRGQKRWQVKFLVLGISAFLAARVYTTSHALLFHGLHLELEIINAGALIVANLFVLISMFRTHFLYTEIYLSPTLLYRSLTLLIVGIYLLAVGVLAKVMDYINGGLSLSLQAFLIFFALVVLAVVLYSARLRLELKKFVSLHLRRPKYDYRKVWSDFTRRTATLVEEKALCNSVAKMIAEMFNIFSVTLWLLDDRGQGLKLGGSTTLADAQVRDLISFGKGASDLLRFMGDQEIIIDLDDDEFKGTTAFRQAHESFLKQARIRYCIPMRAGDDFLGLITIDDHIRGLSLAFEDLDILKTIAGQVAATLLNYKLSEKLQNAKEMEAFQTVAALFVHDLKNVASKLSLILQNIRAHFENPAFREDALRSISKSVEKINTMCSRLSLIQNRLEIQPVETDLNQVLTNTLAGLNGIIKVPIVQDFHFLPKVLVDPEQIGKVLTNLVLNANDAAGDGGKIRVTTGTRDGWVELAVIDNGCGMSREYMDQCLFRPFRSNKEQGTGIGLFHSKMIVDAHEGEIEVESREGEGSTFRVILPNAKLKEESLKVKVESSKEKDGS
jgi:putative PEP-CTERM system histidine kinase